MPYPSLPRPLPRFPRGFPRFPRGSPRFPRGVPRFPKVMPALNLYFLCFVDFLWFFYIFYILLYFLWFLYDFIQILCFWMICCCFVCFCWFVMICEQIFWFERNILFFWQFVPNITKQYRISWIASWTCVLLQHSQKHCVDVVSIQNICKTIWMDCMWALQEQKQHFALESVSWLQNNTELDEYIDTAYKNGWLVCGKLIPYKNGLFQGKGKQRAEPAHDGQRGKV